MLSISESKVVRISYANIAREVSIQVNSRTGTLSEAFLASEANEMSDVLGLIKARFKPILDRYMSSEARTHEQDEAYVAFFKMIEHTDLVVVQKITFNQETAEKIHRLEENIRQYDQMLCQSEEKAKMLDERLRTTIETVDELKSKVMAEIMAIMGIFASIIFAVFGGLQQIGEIGSSLSATPLHKIFIFSGISALVLTYIVFLAFNSTAKLTGKKLGNCLCTDEIACQTRGVIHEHPTLMIMTWLFSSMIGVGFLILIYKKYVDAAQYWKDWLPYGIIVAIIVTGIKVFYPSVLTNIRKVLAKSLGHNE